MNREIKFRAWDKVSEKMLSPQDLIDREIWISPDGEVFDVHETHDYYSWIKFVKKPDLILMQSTGLHDKNGKEIWIGDIVKYQDYNTSDKREVLANVHWINSDDWSGVPFLYPFTNPVCGKYEEDGRTVVTNYITPPTACEIIGNIYEPPHLLGKEE
jgi:uncharacterized phage protein (TIGR01671 family)